MDILDNIINKIKSGSRFFIFGHVDPDGDCIFSQLAMNWLLKKLGKESILFNPGPFIKRPTPAYKKFFSQNINLNNQNRDWDIIIDASTPERLGHFKNFVNAEKAICIDHHITNDGYLKINWIVPQSHSTAELIFQLITKFNVSLDLNIAQYLLDGIVADTGFFRFIDPYNSNPLMATSSLVGMGANLRSSYHKVYENYPLSSIKILICALKRLKLHYNDKVAFTYITYKDMKKYKIKMIDSPIIYSQILSIKGINLVFLFKQTISSSVDVGMRSSGQYNIANIAKYFNGGGHPAAAGCTIQGNLKQVMKCIKNKVKQEFPDLISD